MDFFMFFMLFFCFVLFFHLWLRCCTCQEKMIFWAWIQCFNNILKWAYLVQGVEHQCLKSAKITRGISAFIKVWSTEKKEKKKKKPWSMDSWCLKWKEISYERMPKFVNSICTLVCLKTAWNLWTNVHLKKQTMF